MEVKNTTEQSAFQIYVEKYIKNGLQEEVNKEFDLSKERLIRDLENRKNEICAGILIGVMKTVNIEQLQDRLVITIREIQK